MPAKPPYRRRLNSSADLETTYEATRAGFVARKLLSPHGNSTGMFREGAGDEIVLPAPALLRGLAKSLLEIGF